MTVTTTARRPETRAATEHVVAAKIRRLAEGSNFGAGTRTEATQSGAPATNVSSENRIMMLLLLVGVSECSETVLGVLVVDVAKPAP